MLEPGLYSLVMNVTLPDGRTVSRSAGILLSDWDVTFAGDERVQGSDAASQSSDGQGIERRRLPAISAMHVFKDGPQAF
jgi:hypothetical protein